MVANLSPIAAASSGNDADEIGPEAVREAKGEIHAFTRGW
jgi:hypothetical protein